MDDIKVNDIVEVTVTGIQKYGAFVLINNKYDGLIHISEISSGYVKNINDYIRKINEYDYAFGVVSADGKAEEYVDLEYQFVLTLPLFENIDDKLWFDLII